MPHSLGVAVEDLVSNAKTCSVILERNTQIPVERTKMYGAVRDDQTHFHILVLQGEEGQDLDDALTIGEDILELPARSTAQESLEASMQYNESGLAVVTVHDRISGISKDITFDYSNAKAT